MEGNGGAESRPIEHRRLILVKSRNILINDIFSYYTHWEKGLIVRGEKG